MDPKCNTSEAAAVETPEIVNGDLPFEKESPADYAKRIASRRPELANAVNHYTGRADLLLAVPSPDVDANARVRDGERHLRGINAARDDGTPDLFDVPDHPGVTWPELVEALVRDCQWKMVQPDGQVVVAVDGEVIVLSDAKKACRRVRHRVKVAITGNRSDPQKAEYWKERILAKRPLPNSRPAWRSELFLESKAIRTAVANNEAVPPALVRLLPFIDDAIRVLDKAVDGRAIPRETRQWARSVQVYLLALDLVLGDFLSWAAGTATDHRFALLENALNPRNSSDRERAEAAMDAEELEEGAEEDGTEEEALPSVG